MTMKSNDSTKSTAVKEFQRYARTETAIARLLIFAMLASLMLWSGSQNRVRANDGDLDLTFGIGGKVTTDFGPFEEEFGGGIAIQADGKIVIAGIADLDFLLVRYNTNGSLDSSFGSGGKVETDFSNSGTDVAECVAIQSDGKLVVSGFAGSRSNGLVARYEGDGGLDLSFGSGGSVTCPIGELGNIVIQPDGKIVVAGDHFGVARLNSDGSFDATFGSGGVLSGLTSVSTPFGNAFPSSWRGGLALQDDGKMIVAGWATAGCLGLFALVRCNPDGTLDSSFGSGGWVFTSLGPLSEAHDVIIQPDG